MRDEPVNETGAYLTLNYLTKEGGESLMWKP